MSDALSAQDDRVRLGITGFGRLARSYYVPALSRLPGVRVVAVADPSVASRSVAAALLPGVRLHESIGALLDNEPLDGLLVASPPSAHLATWNAAAALPGVAVFMEKPFVLPGQLPAADASPAAVSRLMVNFNRRFWPRYRHIARMVRDGAIGRVVSAELELQVDVTKWLSVTPHRLQPGEGGVLYDLGSQMLDLAAFLVGARPTGVRATATGRGMVAERADVDLTFPSGATARCLLAYDRPTRERITVRGSDGDVTIADPNMGVHVTRVPASAPARAARRAVDTLMLARHAALRHTSMSRYTIERAIAAFTRCVRSGEPFSPGFDDAHFSTTLLAAAERSIARGSPEPVDRESSAGAARTAV